MFPDELKNLVEMNLSAKFGSLARITDTKPVGGGCINEAYSLVTTVGKYFVKYNSATAFPGMFEKEAAGLNLLSDTNTFLIPEVFGHAESGKWAYLLLRYIENGISGKNFFHEFGIKLADLHRNTAEYFGLDHDNYIGSLTQYNTKYSDFYSFFIQQRIEPQLKEARNKGAFSLSDTRHFDTLFKILHTLIPAEIPALLHGDLWNGNYMVASDGSPCLIDPAVYYGHREADIAMTQLFGGFQTEFYHAYNEAWPMENGWQKRIDIFNLYPLLVHVNLFGGGYVHQVLRIIRQF